MTRIRNGWILAKKSWSVLRSDRSLLVFPILSGFFVLLALALIWGGTALAAPDLFSQETNAPSRFEFTAADEEEVSIDPILYAIFAVSAFVSTALAVYFNVGLAACASRSLRGEDTRVGEGLRAANGRLGAILGWALLATVVGLILRAIEARFRFIGDIVAALLGAAWAIASFFAIPLIALEGKGPIATLKGSAKVVKEKWGEGLTGYAAISIITLLAVLVVLFPFGLGVALAAEASIAAAVAVGVVGVVCLVLVLVLSATLNQIFRVAVYEFARTGQASGAFTSTDLNAAFVPKGAKPDLRAQPSG
jgi:hypothetical protein